MPFAAPGMHIAPQSTGSPPSGGPCRAHTVMVSRWKVRACCARHAPCTAASLQPCTSVSACGLCFPCLERAVSLKCVTCITVPSLRQPPKLSVSRLWSPAAGSAPLSSRAMRLRQTAVRRPNFSSYFQANYFYLIFEFQSIRGPITCRSLSAIFVTRDTNSSNSGAATMKRSAPAQFCPHDCSPPRSAVGTACGRKAKQSDHSTLIRSKIARLVARTAAACRTELSAPPAAANCKNDIRVSPSRSSSSSTTEAPLLPSSRRYSDVVVTFGIL